jgi:hypothetical protein
MSVAPVAAHVNKRSDLPGRTLWTELLAAIDRRAQQCHYEVTPNSEPRMWPSVRRVAIAFSVAGFAGLVFSAPLIAQAPKGYDTLSARSVAESLKVMAQLEKRASGESKDTAAWFHRGMIAFTLSARAREPNPPAGLDWRQLRLIADKALNRVVALDGDNPEYWMALARFHWVGGGTLDHAMGTEMMKRAFALFHNSPDSAARLELLLREGEDQWFFFNKFEARAVSSFADTDLTNALAPRRDTPVQDPLGPPIQPTYSAVRPTASPGAARPLAPEPGHQFGLMNPPPPAFLRSVTEAAGSDTAAGLRRLLAHASAKAMEIYGLPGDFEARGEDHFLYAQDYFEEAYALAPNDERTFMALARSRIARGFWPQLKVLAEDHVRHVPMDPWGYMALGLSLQRVKSSRAALVAFDTGLARMTPELRRKLDRLDRVLSPHDSIAYAKSDSVTRANEARLTWKLSEPLWSIEAEQPRIEFLARIAFAELRWELPDEHYLGVDSPRGQVFVRYGPPDMQQGPFWTYNSGLMFAFSNPAANHPGGIVERRLDHRIEEWQPARWDNIAETRIDSMPILVARFRAAPDSVDVYVATRAPLKVLDTVRATNARAYANFWLSGFSTPDAFRDSVTLAETDLLIWTRRVPVGPHYYRVESMVPNTLQAGRGAASMMMGTDPSTGFSMRGFGISDMIVATHAESPVAPRRWNDIGVTPLLAPISRTGEMSLVWETYELGRAGASARYGITIKLEREPSRVSPSGRMPARIVRGTTGASNVKRMEAADGVTFQFERDVRYAALLVDNVTLLLDGTPPGEYTLRLDVTDRVTGRRTSRATGIVIR